MERTSRRLKERGVLPPCPTDSQVHNRDSKTVSISWGSHEIKGNNSKSKSSPSRTRAQTLPVEGILRKDVQENLGRVQSPGSPRKLPQPQRSDPISALIPLSVIRLEKSEYYSNTPGLTCSWEEKIVITHGVESKRILHWIPSRWGWRPYDVSSSFNTKRDGETWTSTTRRLGIVQDCWLAENGHLVHP